MLEKLRLPCWFESSFSHKNISEVFNIFRKSITQTPFTTEAANAYFQTITGDTFGPDVSFLATLRALLAPRMGEEDSINLKFGTSGYNSPSICGVPNEQITVSICNSYDMTNKGQLIIHSFAGNHEGNKCSLDAVRDKLTTIYNGYYRQEKISDFYRKSFDLDCYINPELKSAIVFAENIDNRKMHYLQVSILAMLPWYLDPEVGITKEEMDLIYSMRENTPEKYNQCLAKMVERYDFRADWIRKELNGFEARSEEIERDRVRSKIQACDDKIAELNRSVGYYLGERNEYCIRLMGLEEKIAKCRDSEIMEYFLCNKNLVLESVTGANMYFAVKCYLEYFDSDMAERVIRNRGSYIYSDGLTHLGASGAEKAERLMTEIFVKYNPRLRIRFCAAYRFSMNGGVAALSNHTFGPEFDGYMPNTHINNYSCMGNYQMTINELLSKHDYIAAIEQCVASCKSLNWGDSTVMGSFVRDFWRIKCIELPDGSVVKAKQAIQWLEEQDGPIEEMEKKEDRVDEQDY